MDAEEIAKVLAEHQMSDNQEMRAMSCTCGQWNMPYFDVRYPEIQHRDHLAAVLAPLVEQAKREGAAEALASAAVAAEKLRQGNPINGDGSNHTLDRVERAIVGLAGDDGSCVIAAIDAQRRERKRLDEVTYWRFEAINAKTHGDGERERHALDQIALLERAAQTPQDEGRGGEG